MEVTGDVSGSFSGQTGFNSSKIGVREVRTRRQLVEKALQKRGAGARKERNHNGVS